MSNLKVHHLKPAAGSHTKRTRVGRGDGSKGKTAGRGTKGTKARYQVPAAFEGGQMPIHMRLPKLKGFKNRFRVAYQVVNVAQLKKLLFTLAMLALYRLGASVPTPNTNVSQINDCLAGASQNSKNIYSLINLFSGGALLKLSVFALGIMPYITASIIIQLLVVVIPRFEQLKKEGQAGQQKLTQYSRYLTIGLAVLQSTGFIALARSGQL